MEANEIAIATRQHVKSEQIAKTLFSISRSQQSGANLDNALDELQETFTIFDETLTGFDKGGVTRGTDGRPFTVSAVTSPSSRKAVDQATRKWKRYRKALVELLETDRENLQILADATRTALAINKPMLHLMNDLTLTLDNSDAMVLESPVTYISLANRQARLIQQITKALFEVTLGQTGTWDITEPISELSETVQLFENTLGAFDHGGIVKGIDGRDIELLPISDFDAREIVSTSRELWESLKLDLVFLIHKDIHPFKTLGSAIQISALSSVPMAAYMKSLALTLQEDYSKKAALLKYVQFAGIAIALLMFTIMVFHFVRQLKRTDEELIKAKEETDQIMDTVNDGLFLLDRKLDIGGQHSASLAKVMRHDELADTNFLAVLGAMVPENVLGVATDYVNLLFGDRVNENLIAGLNPMEELEVHFKDDNGNLESSYLSFSFKRIHENKKVSHLLVQVDDVTDKTLLARELESSKERTQEQFDLLVNVLHVEPTLLAHFLSETDAALESINKTLQTRASGAEDNQNKVEKIFRAMHAIKGDAAGLDLTLFVNQAHEFENMLEELRDNPDPGGTDFIPLTIKLDDFMRQVEQFKTLIEKLGSLNKAVLEDDTPAAISRENPGEADADKEPAGSSLQRLPEPKPKKVSKPVLLDEKNFVRYANRIAKEQNKSVAFILRGEENLPEQYHSPVKCIFNQLIGNSVMHGIERPQERAAVKKSTCGAIIATVEREEDERVRITFRDDGVGVSLESLRETAVEKALCTQQEVEALSDKQSMDLIFKPGLSSAVEIDGNAGRGVGMDFVATTVKEQGGEISVDSKPGSHCEVRIWLPAMEENAMTNLEVA